MRIVSIDRFYAPHGGKERYQFELAEVLTQHGHVVIPFALAEHDNVPSPFDRYFPPALAVRSPNPLAQARAALRRAYNHESARALGRLLDETRPDIAHIHCLHHVSVSAARLLRARGIPMVYTLHDYQLICPVATLFRDGHICEACRPHRYHQAVLHRCSHGKVTNSLAAALDSSITWLSREITHARRFIAPSHFVAKKFVDFGFPADRIVHLPYFAPTDKWTFELMPTRGPVIFAGRLQRLKGAHVFLDALKRLALDEHQEVVILGDGPERAALELQARQLGLRGVIFAGFLDHASIRDWYRRSLFAVVPSLWHEVLGFAVLEPFSVGRPVIGARSGGIPEVIEDGVNGVLVDPGDPAALAAAIGRLLANPSERTQMGARARARAEEVYGPEAHYNALLTIYDSALGR